MGIKIRGIYALALTQFFLAHDWAIVQPTEEVKNLYPHNPKVNAPEPMAARIRDSQSQQGILIQGDPQAMGAIIDLLRNEFFTAIPRKRIEDGLPAWEVEFPRPAKDLLDEWRNRVLPSIPNHHRLRIIGGEILDHWEKIHLLADPVQRGALARRLEHEWIFQDLVPGRNLAIEMVKPDGRVIALPEGEIIEADPAGGRFVFERLRSKDPDGQDGWNFPSARGDYVRMEIGEGDWFSRHAYFRRDGTPIGEVFAIQTPVEFYPRKIRFIHLEVDLLRGPGEKMTVMEGELLPWYSQNGYLSPPLIAQARKTVQKLRKIFEDPGAKEPHPQDPLGFRKLFQ